MFVFPEDEEKTLLFNFEVLEDLEAEVRKNKGKKDDYHQVNYAVYTYLKEQNIHLQSRDSVVTFVKALEPFNLTCAEKVTLANNPGAGMAATPVIIENNEERLTEDNMREIVSLAKTHLEQ